MKKTLLYAALAMVIAACTSNNYKITGTTEGFADGDTILLFSDSEVFVPTDTLIVKDGKFELSGTTDSTYICILASRVASVSFFIEPGNIKVLLSNDQGRSRVSGTKVNNEWQMINDSTYAYELKMQQLADMTQQGDMTQEKQLYLISQASAIQDAIRQLYLKSAEKNINNELGFFILTNFMDESIFTPEKVKELVAKLPARMRNRKQVAELLNSLDKEEVPEGLGEPMPPFTLTATDGTTVDIADEVAKHKLTILDFWASWCAPCMREMPFMKELYAKYAPQGLAIIGISLDEDGDKWKEAIKEQGISWLQVSDLQGWKSEAAQLFEVRAIPHMVVVSQDGTVIQRGLRGEDLEQFVKDYLVVGKK